LGIFREFEREVLFFIQHYQYLTKKKALGVNLDILICKGGGNAKAWVGFSPGQDFINIF